MMRSLQFAFFHQQQIQNGCWLCVTVFVIRHRPEKTFFTWIAL